MSNDAERLCQSCGMCCDGTLFLTTPLSAEEVNRPQGLRLPVVATESGPSAPQPCAAHDSRGCSIYERRPKTCQRYRCAALVGLEAGQHTLAAASEQIGRVHAAAAQVEQLLAWPTGSYSFKAYQEWWNSQLTLLGQSQASITHGQVLLKAGTLQVLVKRYISLGKDPSAAR